MARRVAGVYVRVLVRLLAVSVMVAGCGPVLPKFLPQIPSLPTIASQPAPPAPLSAPTRTATPAVIQKATAFPAATQKATATPAAMQTGTATLAPANPTPVLSVTPVLDSPASIVSARVRIEAVNYTGAAASTVSVVRVEAREWPDSGLGCGQPGTVYAQLTVPGWLVVVQAAAKTLEYHTDQAAHKIVLCKETG